MNTKRVVAFGIQVLGSAIVIALYFGATGECPQGRLADLMSFNAEAPFSHRLLFPAIGHVISLAVDITPFRLYQALLGASLVITLLAFTRYLSRTYGKDRSPWLALVLLYPIVINYVALGDYFYPSDLPAIMFTVLGLCAIAEDRFALLAVIVGLGTLNRETAIVLPIAYFLLQFRKPGYIQRSAVLVAIWAAVKVAIVIALGNGKGDLFRDVAASNVERLAAIVTDPGVALWASGIFGGLHLVAVLGYRRLPREIRRLCLAGLVLVVPLFFTGIFTEERIFNELVPIVTLAAIAVAQSIAGELGWARVKAEGIEGR